MIKNLKIKIFILLVVICSAYFSIRYFVGENKLHDVKNLFSKDQKYFIKKYFFPYKFHSDLEKQLHYFDHKMHRIGQSLNQLDLVYLELMFKDSLDNIQVEELDQIQLKNNYELSKYRLKQGFYRGIKNLYPGSGFIDFHMDKLVVLSSRGVLGYSSQINKDTVFRQIENNIEEFISLKQFKKYYGWFSLKDLFIHNNKIFVSYTDEIETDCWNTSIIWADMNYENLEFEKLFSSKDCVNSKNNIDDEFGAGQAGGRIVNFDQNHILFSVGEYKNRYLVQDTNSINGKILKININDSSYQIFSIGHRNPQGLYFDKENNFVLETEHGPYGGDEINLIDIKDFNNEKIQNFGWPIASYGKHYNSTLKKNKKKYPLPNSHKKNGFIEPLKYFVPSIGISQLIKIKENRYVVSSLKDQSLYFFEINNEKKIKNIERIEVKERVRDLAFKNDKLYLFLEDSASVGIISIK